MKTLIKYWKKDSFIIRTNKITARFKERIGYSGFKGEFGALKWFVYHYQKALNWHFAPVFEYKITFVNSQHKNIILRGYFVLKPRSKDFWYTKINRSEKYVHITSTILSLANILYHYGNKKKTHFSTKFFLRILLLVHLTQNYVAAYFRVDANINTINQMQNAPLYGPASNYHGRL